MKLDISKLISVENMPKEGHAGQTNNLHRFKALDVNNNNYFINDQ